ncbi:MAG TPA: ABC transporter substrate-binding protein [Bryobacteraceae bacterium]|nr:ABC transporter substrate-binding protein [Bryobacteraceae bacterium]
MPPLGRDTAPSRSRLGTLLLLLLAAAPASWAQCECGAHPPGPPPNRVHEPYADEPEDMRPFSRFTKPYHEHYTKLVEYNGAAQDVPAPNLADLSEVRIGFLGPIREHIDEVLGNAMLHGASLAIDEANARGGYCGKPFRLMVHNDAAVWGASSNEIVKMCYDEQVWAMLGSISGDSTHIALRVALRSEVPIVNSAATDPTIPETVIPWYFTVIQDDRVQGYTLAHRIYTERGLERIAIMRVNDRYGRFGVLKFRDASRRLGHPVVIEQKYMPGDTDFARQLRVIRDSRVDGVVLWADATPAGMILKQMRAMGLTQPVFGSYRVLGDDLFRIAGAAAEGLEAVYPYDPTRDDPRWLDFGRRFATRYQARPDAFSSLGYDAMNILLAAVCRAGLNRGRIRDALTAIEHYQGVTGEMVFDPNCKNVAPMYLGTVKGGKVQFRRAYMQAPYAKVGEAGVQFAGPPLADSAVRDLRIAVFGPQADRLVRALPPSGRYSLIGIPSDVPWGKASTALVQALYKDQAMGLIALDRASSHLAEQIAVKAFAPLIALSADRALTSTNIPWVFRLPPETRLEDAVRCLADAAAKAGPNRGRIREVLASGTSLAGSFRFRSTGELQ